MENTPESVWAAFRETDRLFKESDARLEKQRINFEKEMAKSRAEFDKRMKVSNKKFEQSRVAFDKRMKESNEKFELSCAAYDKRMAESNEKFELSRVAYDKRMEESNEKFEQSRVAFDKRMEVSNEKYELSRVDFERRMKKFEEMTGGLSNNHGMFAEEYFFNSFEKGKQNFFGEKFDDIERNVKGIDSGYKDEYDILLINGKSIAIVEVKFKARDKDIEKVIKKAKTFRINFPKYQSHQVYLALAAMVFDKNAEENCIDNGIAIVKQVGETVIINDEHLKVF